MLVKIGVFDITGGSIYEYLICRFSHVLSQIWAVCMHNSHHCWEMTLSNGSFPVYLSENTRKHVVWTFPIDNFEFYY